MDYDDNPVIRRLVTTVAERWIIHCLREVNPHAFFDFAQAGMRAVEEKYGYSSKEAEEIRELITAIEA